MNHFAQVRCAALASAHAGHSSARKGVAAPSSRVCSLPQPGFAAPHAGVAVPARAAPPILGRPLRAADMATAPSGRGPCARAGCPHSPAHSTHTRLIWRPQTGHTPAGLGRALTPAPPPHMLSSLAPAWLPTAALPAHRLLARPFACRPDEQAEEDGANGCGPKPGARRAGGCAGPPRSSRRAGGEAA